MNIDIVYVSDSISLEHIKNFENLMNVNINKIENPKNWIGGELYIQVCLFNLLEKYFKNKYFLYLLDTNDIKTSYMLKKCKIIILPGWNNEINNNNLFYKYKEKLYTYLYFYKSFNNMKTLTSHKFNDKITSLHYYMIPFTKKDDMIFNSSIRGMIMGKCISHNINKFDTIKNILDKLYLKNIKVFSTMRDLSKMDIFPKYLENYKDECIMKSSNICSHFCVDLLGILSPIQFRKLLQHCKYILCFGNPLSPPTIIEALFSDCIVIAPSSQISEDLHENKNIYFSNDMSTEQIINLIEKIICDEIIFDKNHYPYNYTEENMLKKINALID